MKKLLRYADCLVLLAAILGCLLRLWFQNSGIDNKGLYIPSHPAWILLCILSLGTVVFLWFLSRDVGDESAYEANYSRSIPACVSYILGGIVVFYTGLTGLLDGGNFLFTLTSLFALLAAICLAVAGLERLGGHRPAFFLHMVPCLYFALRLFVLGRELGTQPETCRFLFSFLASLCMIPALYQLWAFDLDQGKRRLSLFWSLCAAYFCLITTFESTADWVFYTVLAAILLSDLCALKYLPKAEVQEAETAPETEAAPAVCTVPPMETAEEILQQPAEEAPQAMPTLQTQETTPQPEVPKFQMSTDIDPEEDMDAFLRDLRFYLDNEERK